MDNKKAVWCLFDGSGLMGQPWAERGYQVYCINSERADHGVYKDARVEHPLIKYINYHIEPEDDLWMNFWKAGAVLKPGIILAFPPCTDLASSGAVHFARKAEADPEFQNKAAQLAQVAQGLANKFGCPYMVENPIGRLSTLWRKPDFIFQPYEYGGYLPATYEHPFFPEYIKPRDAYPKKTCIWCGNGFIKPEPKPVPVEAGYSTQHNKLGGKSAKTKLIRSLTPRGFAEAVFLANRY